MGGRINLNPDVLDAGASVSATVVYTVTDAEKRDGRVSNTATVTGTTPAGDVVTDISGTQDNNDDPTVNIIDDAPQAINDNASTIINQPVSFSLTDNDLPSFNGLDRGSIIIVNLPANGIVQVNPDGTITYTPNRTYSGPDSFTYTITDLKGKISNKALVSIKVIPIDLFIPNTFTPNGDGKNDTFRIIGRESFDSINLLIFNRWGNEVYRRNNYLDDWDGSGLNEGTYYYLITLKKGGNEIVKKGWILLKR
jgi:gliding motility-associated-like protein